VLPATVAVVWPTPPSQALPVNAPKPWILTHFGGGHVAVELES